MWPSRRHSLANRGNPLIDLDFGNERVYLGFARAHQVDLAHEALARPMRPAFQSSMSRHAGGKPLEQEVGRIDGRDSSVEIDEHATFHTRR